MAMEAPELPAVVIDVGSTYVRCGFAGEVEPRGVLLSPLQPEAVRERALG